MKNEKTKTINIPQDLHQKIKVHCAKNGIKINEFVEVELTKIICDHLWEFDTAENRERMWEEVEKGLQ